MAFSMLYPDCDIQYHKLVFYKGKDGKKRQMFADMIVEIGSYKFIVELECSRTPAQIKEDKLAKYDRLMDSNCKVLFVFAPRSWDWWTRPFEYPQVPERIGSCNEGVKNLIIHFTKPYYLAMSIHNFPKLNKAVWYNAKGEKCQLIY